MNEPNSDKAIGPKLDRMNKPPLEKVSGPNANKRRQFSLKMKLKILEAVDSGKRKKDIATEFGISQSTLSTVLKNRSKIEENSREIYLGPYRKRMRGATFRDLDKAVFIWFKEVRSRNIPVNGRRLQEKAKIIAKLLGHDNFRASGGWLSRFRERYGISTRMFDELPVPADDTIDYENFVEVDVHVLVDNEPVENDHIKNEHILNNSIERPPKDIHNTISNQEDLAAEIQNLSKTKEENSPMKQEAISDDNNISKLSYESDIDVYEPPEVITFPQAISAFQIVKKYLYQASKQKKLLNSLKIVEDNLIKTIHR